MDKIDAITKFVNHIDPAIDLTFESFGGFYVDIDNLTINISLDTNEKEDEMFYNFVRKTFDFNDFDIFVLSILHEIGHIMTYEPNTLHERDMMYLILQMAYENGKSLQDYNEAYFNLPAEKLATEWAVSYYRYNRAECDELSKQIWVK